MKSSKGQLFILIVALLVGCKGGGDGGSSAVPGPAPIVVPGSNVLSITVNGSLCSASTSTYYLNKPCVSVTICNPGTSICQTINDILLDTGSFGLRIFKSALNPTISLTPVTIGSGSLAECAQFGDGSSIWGPVQTANVILGSEPAVQVRVQVGDSTFATAPPPACAGALKGPADAFFNGILGVGVFSEDCGPNCPSGIYYTCTGSTCSGTTVATSSQVQNPVALLPVDNNGVIVELPSVSPVGATSAVGSLVLGIGTQTNNVVPSGVTTYDTDGRGEIITTISGSTYSAIIDSGSNGFFFTPPLSNPIPNCGSPNQSWFCPSSTIHLNATNIGALGFPSVPVSFDIGNLTTLTSSGNKVFSDIGGSNAPGIFVWGLPFYLGRNVYVGMEGKGGPYFAY